MIESFSPDLDLWPSTYVSTSRNWWFDTKVSQFQPALLLQPLCPARFLVWTNAFWNTRVATKWCIPVASCEICTSRCCCLTTMHDLQASWDMIKIWYRWYQNHQDLKVDWECCFEVKFSNDESWNLQYWPGNERVGTVGCLASSRVVPSEYMFPGEVRSNRDAATSSQDFD